MFAGEFSCKLDEKGRFALPASLRDRFALPADPEVKKAVLVRSQQERCLWLFPLPNWYALLEVQRQRLSEHESRLFMHYVVSEVLELEVDRAGRLLVPRKFREHAGIDDEAVLVGMYDRLEVWSQAAWQAHLAQLEEAHETALGRVLQMPSIKPLWPGVER
ncbi:MAG: transcriptional regulator MraZ [Candidatus Tectimicrobiota bacterium]|nr:MAG: transcriptional regulator MraZ [Candidatus Tectomicrobia bacterium]